MRIGLWWVDTYTLRILAGGAAALIWLSWETRGTRGERGVTAALRWGILGVTAAALVIGRLGYVLMNLGYFTQHPEALVQLKRTAGIDGIGALVGALAGLGLWTARSRGRHTFRSLLGLLAPASLWIAAGAWWARAGIGEAWGRAASPAGLGGWLVARSPDLYHSVAPRYAVQPAGMIWAALMGLLAWVLGENAGFAMALYLAGAAGLTLLRGDSVPLVRAIRVDMLATASLALVLAIYSTLELTRHSAKRTGPPVAQDWGT